MRKRTVITYLKEFTVIRERKFNKIEKTYNWKKCMADLLHAFSDMEQYYQRSKEAPSSIINQIKLKGQDKFQIEIN